MHFHGDASARHVSYTPSSLISSWMRCCESLSAVKMVSLIFAWQGDGGGRQGEMASMCPSSERVPFNTCAVTRKKARRRMPFSLIPRQHALKLLRLRSPVRYNGNYSLSISLTRRWMVGRHKVVVSPPVSTSHRKARGHSQGRMKLCCFDRGGASFTTLPPRC